MDELEARASNIDPWTLEQTSSGPSIDFDPKRSDTSLGIKELTGFGDMISSQEVAVG